MMRISLDNVEHYLFKGILYCESLICVPRVPDQACFIIRCKNLDLNISDCISRCLSEEILKAVGPFYLVSMPGEVKDPTQGVNRQIPCRGVHTSQPLLW